MGRKPKKDHSTDINVGQHLAFPVAVQLASSELTQDPRSVNLDVIGNALAKVVPLYFQDGHVARPRPLSVGELEGSEVMHRATVLLLKDGRTLSAVSVKRRDLERGIAVLRTAGIPELANARAPKPAARYCELLATVAEIAQLVRPPLLPSQLDRVNALALSIARNAAEPAIAHLAIRLLSAVHDARMSGDSADNQAIALMAARLRDAIRDKDKNNA